MATPLSGRVYDPYDRKTETGQAFSKLFGNQNLIFNDQSTWLGGSIVNLHSDSP
jgi:hypothetical protein